MKKTMLLLSAVILSASVSTAALVVYDSFSGEVSTNAVPAGWVSLTPGVGEHSRIDSGSLSYPGFAESSGNSWGLGQGTADYELTVNDITGLTAGDKVYYSFLMRLNSPLDPFTTGNFRFYNSAAPSGSGLVVGWGTTDHTANLMGFALSSRNQNWSSAISATHSNTPETYTAADTVYLIVVGYHREATYQASTVNLWINPDPASFSNGTPPTATLSFPSYQNATGFNNETIWNRLQFISNGSGAGVPSWQVDEFRVGRTWSDMIASETAAPEPPTAVFSANPVSGSLPLTVAFSDTSTGTVTNRYWDFGDGFTTNITATSVQHTYSAEGLYTVALTASGPAGSDTETQTDLINVLAPVMPAAAFTPSKVSGYEPLTVAFSDTSTGTITNRYWDFGDGVTTNTLLTSVSHTYETDGIYTVSLTASGPAGEDTDIQTNVITVLNVPEGTFIIKSDAADNSIGINSNGTPSLYFVGQTTLSVGDDNYGSGKAEGCAIVVFKLPDLNGKEITAANLEAQVTISWSGATNYPVGLDLYGVRYASSPTVLTNDYGFMGSGPGELIQDNVWEVPASAVYPYEIYETDESGDAALAAWITEQYSAGAVAGDYIFLRYDSDQFITNPFTMGSGDAVTNQTPTLTLVTGSGGSTNTPPSPPPAPVIGLSRSGNQGVISWTTAQGSGYVYSVYYSTNLMSGFLPLQTNMPDTVQSFTNTIDPAVPAAFYKVEAQ